MSNLVYTKNHDVPRLISKITEWAQDRNLIKGATSKDQTLKLIQEVGELSDSICKKKNPIDDIGDCIVVLTILAEQNDLTLQQCIECAYSDIKERKGKMIDGVFVKESDLA